MAGCNYIWSYNSVKFEWDEEKNEQNIRKHGFDFADAWEVFQNEKKQYEKTIKNRLDVH